MGIFFISSVYALGCCFDQSTGTCSPNSDFNSCSGGQFFADPTCNSVSDCDYGCCQIGASVLYTRELTCYNRAGSAGTDYKWFKGSEAQCTAAQTSLNYGACVISTRYSKICSYTTEDKCSNGVFTEGIYCSNPILGVNCTKTSNSVCFGEDAHYTDSCGNVDEIKSDCDYASGNICSQTVSGAICKNLNCGYVDGAVRMNGDRWCLYDNNYEVVGGTKRTVYDLGQLLITDGKQGSFGFHGIDIPVGSRFSAAYCLNGEVVKEPCSDFRMEMCQSGKCVNNPSSDCAIALTQTDCEELPRCWWFDTDPNCGNIPAGSSLWNKPELADYLVNHTGANNSDFPFCKEGGNIIGLNELTPDQQQALIPQYGSAANVPVGAEFVSKSNYDWLNSTSVPKCLPLIKSGLDFYSKKTFTDTECSNANYQDTLTFYSTGYQSFHLKLDKQEAGYFGSLFLLKDADIRDIENITLAKPGLEFAQGSKFDSILEDAKAKGSNPTLEVSPQAISLLKTICKSMGDCEGSVSWTGKASSSSNTISGNVISGDGKSLDTHGVLECTKSSDSGQEHYSCDFVFQCKPYKAAQNGDCSKCGSDGVPCSEYRCKSIAKNCDYFEPKGADKGYCIPSTDFSPPSISSSVSPDSPVPPYTSVEISLSTNEDANCAFNLGYSGSKFDEMDYSFGNGYSRQHKVILNIPGSRPTSMNASSYSLINSGGNYSMYVRCEDPAGNWNLAAHIINFQVMQTPDKIPPVIQSITPPSGSFALFNTTTKSISLKLNEPAECRWSQSDKDFSDMENGFSCNVDISDYGLLNGYFCNGIIANITTNLTKQTRVFIRCKDQPWLEGFEDQYYSRNVNLVSKEYVLKPSSAFSITDVSPSGTVIVGSDVSNISLSARTSGGAESGKAYCMWKYSALGQTTTYYPFTTTNSSVHNIIISNFSEGNYLFQVKCQDAAGNVAYKNSSVFVRVDKIAPLISRIFNDRGNLKLYTDEPAICKFMFASGILSCLFSSSSQNLTTMSEDSPLQHTTLWKKGFTYLIRCADLYGNENSGCRMISAV
jgi:hypothetical protein